MRALTTVTRSQTLPGGIILNVSRGLISLSQQVRSLCAPPPEQASEALVWIYRNVTFASESVGHVKEIVNVPSCVVIEPHLSRNSTIL